MIMGVGVGVGVGVGKWEGYLGELWVSEPKLHKSLSS